jgi:hypothetical protein
MFRPTLSDPQARWLLIVALVNAAPVAVTSTLFLFYVEDRLQLAGLAGPFLLAFFLAAALSAPVWSRLAARLGARATLALGMVLSIGAFLWALTLGAGAAVAFALICLTSGAALGADLVLLPALVVILPRRIGFAAQRPEDYKDQAPVFDLRTHLSGPILCEGVIFGPFGRVTSRFVAEMEGRWDGNRGVLTEHFRYDSGSEQRREWQLKLGNDGKIRAAAADLAGVGAGTVEGGAVQLLYRIRLPEDAGGHVLDVTDWMYLAPNGTIMNRSQFRKFGIKVAELVATMRRVPA